MKKFSLITCLLGLLMTAIIPSADARECQPYCDEWTFSSGQFKVGADWLYWKVEGDNLNIGENEFVESDTFSRFSSVRPKFKWESGYRVNVGYECDCWELGVCYTNLPSHAKARSFVAFPDSIEHRGDEYTFLEGKWKTNINNIDVDLSRTICFGECLKLRPHVGFRSLLLDEKYRIFGNLALEEVIDAELIATNSFTRTKEKFTGYGIEGGLWADWQVGCGLSVVGHMGGSILYSKFRIHERSELVNITTPVGAAPVETLIEGFSRKNTHHVGTPTLDYYVGLQYETEFCEMMFAAHIGWEQHVLFDMNRLNRTGRHGNLTAQGLTLGADLAF